MTFASVYCPPDAGVSHVTQTVSLIKPHLQRAIITFTAGNTDNRIKPDARARPNIILPLPPGQRVFNVQIDDVPHDVSSFFCKATYLFKISIVVTSNALLTVASLHDTGAAPNLIKNFLSLV